MNASPAIELVQQSAQAERYAALVDGLLTGSFWLVVVILVGVGVLAHIKGRFDP